MKLKDVGGKLLAFREQRGLWWCVVGARCGWGTTFREAFSNATRGRAAS